MKINFTKREYRRLIEMLSMADWVMDAYRVEEEEEYKPYQELIQKIYSHAKESGCDHLIDHEKERDRFYETNEFLLDSPHRKFIDEFEIDCFWEMLITFLSKRDVVKEVGESTFANMNFEEQINLIADKESYWGEEFEKHGLNRISINKK